MKTTKVKVILSLLTVVLLAWTFSSCSKSDSTPAVVTTSLTDQITVATNLLATTTEGTAAGQYPHGSQATLLTAITAAEVVLNATNPKPTQADITNATANLAAAVTVYQTAVVVPIAPDNLMGQWTFDELTTATVGTTVKDYSGNSLNGTLQAGHAFWSTAAGFQAATGIAPPSSYPASPVNVPTITKDRYGNQHALHFMAGANVDIPYNALINPQSITVSLWAKEDTIIQTGNYQWINNQYMIALNRWNGWKFNMQNSPRAFFTANLARSGVAGNYDNQDNNVTLTGITNNWIHYVATFANGTMALYINGINTVTWTTAGEVGTMALMNGAAGTATAPVDLVIGQDLPTSAYSTNSNDPTYLNWGGFYSGSIDDVRVYNTALTAAQVLSIYTAEKP